MIENPQEVAKETPSATASTELPDPFDLESLALRQDFAETVGVTKLLKTIPVRRPNPQDFFRVHPSADYRRNLLVLELKDDRETFLVQPKLTAVLVGEATTKTLFTAISRQGVVFLWPVTFPPPDGRTNEWWRSGREAAEHAMTHWIRLRPNLSLGAYDVYEAEGKIPDPEWPELPYKELLRIGFRDRLVDRVDHPVIARLRGR
jgi:hypothetical protein